MRQSGKSIAQNMLMQRVVEASLFLGLVATYLIYEKGIPVLIKHYIDPVSKLAFAEEIQVV